MDSGSKICCIVVLWSGNLLYACAIHMFFAVFYVGSNNQR
jgi:type IV secretory pathway VirB3-like protein